MTLVEVLASGALAVWVAGVWIGFQRCFTPASPRASRRASMPGDQRRQVLMRTDDGVDLVGWYYPGRLDAAIIVSWGYRSVTDDCRPLCRALQGKGFHVFAHAWRGTEEASRSRCTGGPLESLDVRAAVDAASTMLPEAPIGVIGLSLGGAIVLHAARDDARIRAVCVDSLLTSPRDWLHDRYAARLGPFAWLFTDAVLALAFVLRGANVWHVRPLEDMAALPPRPLVLITSAVDQFVGPSRQQVIRAAAPPLTREWIVKAGHCDGFFAARHAYTQFVADFFGGMITTPGSAVKPGKTMSLSNA